MSDVRELRATVRKTRKDKTAIRKEVIASVKAYANEPTKENEAAMKDGLKELVACGNAFNKAVAALEKAGGSVEPSGGGKKASGKKKAAAKKSAGKKAASKKKATSKKSTSKKSTSKKSTSKAKSTGRSKFSGSGSDTGTETVTE